MLDWRTHRYGSLSDRSSAVGEKKRRKREAPVSITPSRQPHDRWVDMPSMPRERMGLSLYMCGGLGGLLTDKLGSLDALDRVGARSGVSCLAVRLATTPPLGSSWEMVGEGLRVIRAHLQLC